MLRKILFTLVLSAGIFSIQAQSTFHKGNLGVNLGMGFGWIYGTGHDDINELSSIPSVNLSMEYGTIKFSNESVLGLGLIGTYRVTSDNGTGISPFNYEYNYDYKNTILAARGVYHFGLFDSGGFDFYAGIHMGVRLSESHFVLDYEDPARNDRNELENNTDFIHDVFVGSRYFFTDNFGFFAEAGYGISYFKFGVAIKF